MFHFSTNLEFKKIISVVRAASTQVFNGLSTGIDIYTSDDMGVQVTFICNFATTVDLTTDATITTPVDVTGDVTISTGTFDAGLHLDFYQTNAFATKLTASQTIGTVMYAGIIWDVTTLSAKVGFYVDNCKVELQGGSAPTYTYSHPISIIRDTCFANVVETTAVANSGSQGTTQYVANNFYFTYKSFSYSTSTDSVQRLTCEIVFCTHTVPSSGALAVDSGCAGMHSSTKKADQTACNGVADHSSYDWKYFAQA